ncbi:helix-turn-helix domain-containing protein [Actinomadura hibisca]|uniref:helix-turn-helix domain-containing protein n=1 Tax=Actinomadura hibisca TaxID=68565 RepID=UPI0014709168|nr:helix-turn-helix transcriptional regulator [Actinomadura hibisca]
MSYALRKLRAERRLTIDQVIELSGGDWSPSTLSRWERGERRIRPADLKILLEIYEVPPEQREAMLKLTREARKKGWWEAFSKDVVPPWFETYLGLESDATKIQVYEAELFHGLVQTPGYHRAFIQAAPVVGPPDHVEQAIALRAERQQRLTGENPPDYWIVLNEAVIRRAVGGPVVMREQLLHVAKMAEEPNVNVQVLPFRAGAHTAMDGSFEMLSFPDSPTPGVVYLESKTSALYLETDAEVERYTLMFNHLIAKSLDPDESRALLVETAEQLT